MLARPPLRVTVGVGLVAACTLALQVLLTRLFSAVLFYHFAFFSISLALLGTGAGALVLYVRPQWFERPSIEAALARWSAALAVGLVVAPFILVRLDYGYALEVTNGLILRLTVAAVLAALLFFAAGVVIALAIKTYVSAVGRVYAFDLAGAALGAIAVVPLLKAVSAPTLLVSLGIAAALAALLFGWGIDRERRLALGVGGVAVVLTLLSAATSMYYLPAPYEKLYQRDLKGDHWTPISRVVGYPPQGAGEAALTYDQDFAPVPHYKRGERLPDWNRLELGPQSIGYELTGPGHALVIGGGGGRDIYNALSVRQRVDVIELNAGIRKVVDEDLAEWSGSPYTLPGVSSAIGDGRSTLAARDTKYDTVHIGFTNTLAASGSGSAYALSENHLYTVEAFQEYFDHLKPGGLLNISRPYRFTGEEALRATVLMLEAMRERGVRDPSRHVVVLLAKARNGYYGTVLAKLEPFTRAELAVVRRLAPQRDHAVGEDTGVMYAPGGPYRREWASLARARDLDAWCSSYRSNVCAPTDDKPFFLNPTRLGDIFKAAPPGATFLSRTPFFILLAVLGILLVLSAVAFALPLWLVRRAARPPVGSLGFFAAIGLGFLIVEVVLIQRFVLFLGYPTYALSVVLFSLLLFTGAGAYLSGRAANPRRLLVAALGAACVLIASGAFLLDPLLDGLLDLPFALRVAVTIALLAPLGLCLGTAMPVGLSRLSAMYPSGVPWAWGINGVMSVVASVLAIMVALNWGFTVTTLVGLAAYVGALGHALWGRWPDDDGDAPAEAADAKRVPAAA